MDLYIPQHRDPIARGVLILIALALAWAGGSTAVARVFTPAATPPPIILIPTPTLGVTLGEAPAADTSLALSPAFLYQLGASITVYDAPRGQRIGDVEPGRGYTPIGRNGTDWVQLDVEQSGLVWTPIGGLSGVAIAELPNVFTPDELAAQAAQRAAEAAASSNAQPQTVNPADAFQPVTQPASELIRAVVSNESICGPKPDGSDKWVCDDSRGWIMPGIDDPGQRAASPPTPAPAPPAEQVHTAPDYKVCGGRTRVCR